MCSHILRLQLQLIHGCITYRYNTLTTIQSKQPIWCPSDRLLKPSLTCLFCPIIVRLTLLFNTLARTMQHVHNPQPVFLLGATREKTHASGRKQEEDAYRQDSFQPSVTPQLPTGFVQTNLQLSHCFTIPN